MSFGGGGSGTSTVQTQPYAPAEPALNQILSEAGTIYGQGPAAAGYVPPTQQTLQGLASQEQIAQAANQQILNTIQGQYTNPFLSPLISQAATDIYSNVADRALPYAFGQLERERARQLSTAQQVPSLTAVGGQLEDIQRQQQMAPMAALQQYYNVAAPIAFGLPRESSAITPPRANPVTMAAGGAMSGAALAPMLGATGGMGAALGAGFGLLGGLL